MFNEKIKLEESEERVYRFLERVRFDIPKRLGKLLAMYYPDARIRKKFSRYIGMEMGEGTFANLGLKVVPNDNTICLHIGKNVSIAPNVVFLCGTEPNNGTEIKEYEYVKTNLSLYADIWVEDEAWIGANAVIFPGVRIGRCSVIGSGSIVRNDTEPYCIYAGAPARKVRDIRTGMRCEE